MNKLDNLLSMTNEEVIEWFRKDILEKEPGTEWMQRLKEYRQKIDSDFKVEWSKKHFKWFFKKCRQQKLRSKIVWRYASPIDEIVEECIDDLLPRVITGTIDSFADIKDITIGDYSWFADEKGMIIRTRDVLSKDDTEKIKKMADDFSKEGCTSFAIDKEQIESMIDRFNKENQNVETQEKENRL